ncbi:hypothetical protein SG34_032210 [Thalassomonas viridans]|uniref:Uncharacterized protein n=1 Tax=Thalassomonas viridans TaxID=137584 RepID=A0AAE9Z995_9GAMM|nr:hypothetical protein [Thalassomonas viridans]WDE08587.1 hypothetical protein SG34_032210 [Thalassomonas viridans]
MNPEAETALNKIKNIVNHASKKSAQDMHYHFLKQQIKIFDDNLTAKLSENKHFPELANGINSVQLDTFKQDLEKRDWQVEQNFKVSLAQYLAFKGLTNRQEDPAYHAYVQKLAEWQKLSKNLTKLDPQKESIKRVLTNAAQKYCQKKGRDRAEELFGDFVDFIPNENGRCEIKPWIKRCPTEELIDKIETETINLLVNAEYFSTRPAYKALKKAARAENMHIENGDVFIRLKPSIKLPPTDSKPIYESLENAVNTYISRIKKDNSKRPSFFQQDPQEMAKEKFGELVDISLDEGGVLRVEAKDETKELDVKALSEKVTKMYKDKLAGTFPGKTRSQNALLMALAGKQIILNDHGLFRQAPDSTVDEETISNMTSKLEQRYQLEKDLHDLQIKLMADISPNNDGSPADLTPNERDQSVVETYLALDQYVCDKLKEIKGKSPGAQKLQNLARKVRSKKAAVMTEYKSKAVLAHQAREQYKVALETAHQAAVTRCKKVLKDKLNLPVSAICDFRELNTFKNEHSDYSGNALLTPEENKNLEKMIDNIFQTSATTWDPLYPKAPAATITKQYGEFLNAIKKKEKYEKGSRVHSYLSLCGEDIKALINEQAIDEYTINQIMKEHSNIGKKFDEALIPADLENEYLKVEKAENELEQLVENKLEQQVEELVKNKLNQQIKNGLKKTEDQLRQEIRMKFKSQIREQVENELSLPTYRRKAFKFPKLTWLDLPKPIAGSK